MLLTASTCCQVEVRLVYCKHSHGVDNTDHRQSDGNQYYGSDRCQEGCEDTGYLCPVFRDIDGVLCQEYSDERISRHQVYASLAGRDTIKEDDANQCYQAEQFFFFHGKNIIPAVFQHLFERSFFSLPVQTEEGEEKEDGPGNKSGSQRHKVIPYCHSRVPGHN